MILIIGPIADSAIANLILLLSARDIDYVVLDPRSFADQWDLVWWVDHNGVQGHIDTPKRRIDLEEIGAIWDHMMVLPQEPRPGKSWSIRNDQLTSLTAFYNTYPGLVINRPTATSSNGSKPYQQQAIVEQGFRPIRTLITTDPDAARAFCEECNGQVIFKSISGVRSVVRRLLPDDMARIDQVRHCPTQFQEFVPGTDIRVHAVGERLFATEIQASTDDYRYVPMNGIRTMRGVDLPDRIAERCIRLNRALGLIVSGIDLRRDPDGRYCCFEVNPNPGYIFYERQSRQRIGDAFVDLLQRAESERCVRRSVAC